MRFLLAMTFAAAALAPSLARAQDLPPGVTLGMAADDLRHALPGLEKVRRPPRMAGGLVGAWRSPDAQVLEMTGERIFFIAHGHLARVEFDGSAPDPSDNGAAFHHLLDWGRSLYGPEVAANDAGARYAEWTAGDVQVYAQYKPGQAQVRLIYKRRAEQDAGQL